MDNGLSLCETKDKCRKTKGRGGSRLWLRFATPRQRVNETLASPDNEATRQLVGRQPVGFAGITDLWNHGLTELWNYG